MSSNRKPWTERILTAATKQESISSTTLRRTFRLPQSVMSNEEFNVSVGRSLVHLAQTGRLKRTSRGQYEITKKGLREYNNYIA